MSHPPNTVEHPSSMNPIWVEQQCMAPTLPDLSPQPRIQQACNPPTFILATNRNPNHSTYHTQAQHHRHHLHRCNNNNNATTHHHHHSHSHAHRHPQHVHSRNQNLYHHHAHHHAQQQQQQQNRSTSTNTSTSTPPQPMDPIDMTANATNAINTARMPIIALNALNERERIELQVPNPFGPMRPIQQHATSAASAVAVTAASVPVTNYDEMHRNMVPVPVPSAFNNNNDSNNGTKSKSIIRKKKKSKCIAMDKASCAEKAANECAAYKGMVRGWWIGQRLECETQSGTQMAGEIKDYCVESDRVQIWYNNDEVTFECIKLSDLLNWNVPSTRRISAYDSSVPSALSYKPLPLDLLQRVSVKYRDGEWYTAFIDGFDPISRRHHVNYGDTSQWLWTNKKNIKPLPFGHKILKHVEAMRDATKSSGKYVIPPPFDPIPYELSPTEWTAKSIQMCKDKIIKKDLYFYCKELLRDPHKYLKLNENENRKKRKREEEEDASEDDDDDLSNNEFELKAPTKPPPPKKKKKKRIVNKKYPRFVILNGVKWNRAYSKEEKKYFWTNSRSNESSWNPWNDIANMNAPWLTSKQKYTKFKDDADKPYWYNYQNGVSTYHKPNDYVSSDEILYDSAAGAQ